MLILETGGHCSSDYGRHREVANSMKVKELTVEELKALIQDAIEEKLEEVIGDPDRELELRPEIKERLRHSLTAIKHGEKGIPIDEVVRQAGLDW